MTEYKILIRSINYQGGVALTVLEYERKLNAETAIQKIEECCHKDNTKVIRLYDVESV
jgi:hypothetical protein